jgi:predicted RNase H-like nuclease (RuvC/YqgF family)
MSRKKGADNVKAFTAWAATQTDDDFKQMIYLGNLSRSEIVKQVGFSYNAIKNSESLKTALGELEDSLRKKGVLPQEQPLAALMKDEVKEYDKTANRKARDNNHLSELEVANMELNAENKELREKLERFKELSETIAEMGLLQQ